MSPIQPYFDWKDRLDRDCGVGFGFYGYFLYQHSSQTLPDAQDYGLGGIFRFQGSWEAFARETGHPGRLDWRVENRSALGSVPSPSQLGDAVGSAVLNPGFGYTHNFDTDLAVLSWTQKFGHERVGVAFGRLAYDVYLDAFAFQTFSRGFFNRAFIVNPTLGTTGIGALGAVAKGFVSDHFWLGAQAYDGNAASGRFDFSTLKEYEWLWAVEFGWTPGFDRLKTDRIQLTYWNKDTRVKAGVPSGQGIALSMSWQISEQFLPFVRAGYSDGGASVPAEGALSAGLEYTVCKDQVWSVGLGWARPSEKTYSMDLRDEFVVETSYRVQVFPSFSLTPDLQLLLQPAQSPAENMVWVLGIRGILSF